MTSVIISTAAWLIDAVPRPMPVSVRARLPVASAWRNSRLSVERDAALALRDLPRRADLAEDLALAEHGRVEAGGDLEQMGDRGVVVLAVQVRVQLVEARGRRARTRSHGCRRRRRGSARRRRRPRCGCTCDSTTPRGRCHAGRDRRRPWRASSGAIVTPLQQRQRTAAVVDSDDEDRHAIPAYAVAPRRGSPGTARSPGAGAADARRCS